MDTSQEQEVINLWNRYHSVNEVSDIMGIPQTEVKDVLNIAKGSKLYIE